VEPTDDDGSNEVEDGRNEIEEGGNNEMRDDPAQEEGNEIITKSKLAAPSQYLIDKQKNIEEIGKILAELKEQFPVEDLNGKKAEKRSISKKKQPVDGPVIRRESHRVKDKR